jgi:hypothetical protein
MKIVGIRNVQYSVNSREIICENVKDMISIDASYVTKHIDNMNLVNKITHEDNPYIYYEQLLCKFFPPYIKQYNLDNFIKYNLNNVLPLSKVIVSGSKLNKQVTITDQYGKIIVQSTVN